MSATGASLATEIPAIIAAVGSGTALIITALNRRTATTTESKVDEHGTEIAHIKTNVDGALTGAVNRATVAEGQNEQLTQALKDSQAKNDP